MSLPDHLRRRARKLNRETGSPIVALGLEALPSGGAEAFYSMAGVRLGEVEFMVLALLRGIETDLMRNAGEGCEDCARCLERVTAAAAAIQPAFPNARPPFGTGSC